MKCLVILLTIVVASFVFSIPEVIAGAAVGETPQFCGAKKCKKCHNMRSTGKQYKKWKKGPHAHAYKVLASPESQAIAAKMGIANAQTSGKCLKCHSTAYNYTENRVSTAIKVKEGVSCESCHGPGSLYRERKIMKNLQLAVANGLIADAKAMCIKCHNEGSPTYKVFGPEKYEITAHPNPKRKKKN